MLSAVGSPRLLDSARPLLINLYQAWIYSLKARFLGLDLRNCSRCSKKGQQSSQRCKINYWTTKNHRKSHWKNAKKLLPKITAALQTRIAYSTADRLLVLVLRWCLIMSEIYTLSWENKMILMKSSLMITWTLKFKMQEFIMIQQKAIWIMDRVKYKRS